MIAIREKVILAILLLFLGSSSVSHAEVKFYQYDGKLPFAQMMLNMMVAMGVLDRIPAHGIYGGYGAGYGSGYGPYGVNNLALARNPYLRALAMRGYPVQSLYGNSFGNYPGLSASPFLRSPWGSSPWASSPWNGTPFNSSPLNGTSWNDSSWLNPSLLNPSLNGNGWNGDYFNSPSPYAGGYSPYGVYPGSPDSAALWSSNEWGVLPVDDLDMLDLPLNSPWRKDELAAWQDEPWDHEARNSTARNNQARSRDSGPALPAQQPVVLNNIITNNPPAAAAEQQTAQAPQFSGQPAQNPSQRPSQKPSHDSSLNSPLARLVQPGVPASSNPVPDQAQPAPSQKNLQASPLYKYSQRAGKYVMADPEDSKVYQKRQQLKSEDSRLCVSEHCGLQKPVLDGLWLAQNGEMLGIKSGRYLWSDGVSRYLTGQLKVLNEYLLADVEGYERVMRFKYKLANNHLLTMQPDGKIREFVRVPTNLSFAGQAGNPVYPGDSFPPDMIPGQFY